MNERQIKIAKSFKAYFNGGVNFMTPYPIEYGQCGKNLIYEISEGTAMNGMDKLYGVTFLVDKSGIIDRPDNYDRINKSFDTIKEAYFHIWSQL